VWSKSDTDTRELLPTTLCARNGRIFFQSTSHVICVNAETGQVDWKTKRPVRTKRLAWSAPTVVAHKDVVLSADCSAPATGSDGEVAWTVTAKTASGDASLGKLIAFSTKDGRELWRCKTALGYNSPADIFISGGIVWASYAPGRNTTDFTEGRDLYTGEVKHRFETEAAFTETHHHRCYRNKATDRFILLGRTGIELIDLSGGEPLRHCWIRGACQYGLMPANGLLYLPPHSCACYIQSKLSGFWALAPAKGTRIPRSVTIENRLQKGPAYNQIENRNSQIENLSDWPTYRRDGGRTGRTKSAVPTKLERLWQVKLGSHLTSPVVGSKTLLVASIDTHPVHALDAESSDGLWDYTAGGRIDSPPTIHKDLAVFGCADGGVYCLRLADGKLVWRFQAAPADLRTVAFGQVESLWPVTGSVLVRDGIVYCTAGRSSYLDGGMYLYRLNSTTGALLGKTRFYDRDPQTGRQPEDIIEDVELPGALPDILVCDGQNIYLRDKVLDFNGIQRDSYLPHLYSSAGLLDDTWWHRTYWLWGERTWGRASGWHVMPGLRPSGRILVTDETTVFGFGRQNVRGNDLQGYHLFRADKQVQHLDRPAGPLMEQSGGAAAGEPAFDESGEAAMLAFSAEDGRTLSRCRLDAQPVFDGMAAAYGRLYVSTVDGKIACFGGK
jgi:outer membrane protein assembly factor BamB